MLRMPQLETTFNETAKTIATVVDAMNIESEFIKDLAIIQQVKLAGVTPISLLGNSLIEKIRAIVR